MNHDCIVVRILGCRSISFGFDPSCCLCEPWASSFNLCCSSSLNCINEHMAISTGGYYTLLCALLQLGECFLESKAGKAEHTLAP